MPPPVTSTYCLRDRASNFPTRRPAPNKSNALSQNRTEPNRTEQDRTRLIDKTMTKLTISIRLDHPILSNTQEITADSSAINEFLRTTAHPAAPQQTQPRTSRTPSARIEQNRTRSNTPERQNHDKIDHFHPPRSSDPQQYTGDHRRFPRWKIFPRNAIRSSLPPQTRPRTLPQRRR